MVRVTSTMLSSNYLKNVNRNLTYMQKMQSQLSTGKEISKPSDDPYKASRVIQMYDEVSKNKQYNANIADVSNFLDVTDSALYQMTSLLGRVRELMVASGNAAYGSEQLQSIQDEMQIKVDQIGQILNTSYDGKYIFGGTKVDSKPVTVVDGKLQYANSDGQTVGVYKDSTGKLTSSSTVNTKIDLTKSDTETNTIKTSLTTELDGLKGSSTPLDDAQKARKEELEGMLAVPPTKQTYKNNTGSGDTYTSGTGGNNTQVDMSSVNRDDIDANAVDAAEAQLIKNNLDIYDQISADMRIEISQGVSISYNKTASEILQAGDINLAGLMNDIINNLGSEGDKNKVAKENLGDLDKIVSNLLTKSSEVGAMQNRMDSAKVQNESENYNLTTILSSIEDIDFTEKMIDFSTLMTVYKASLQISSKILPQTIMDYL